MACGIPAIASKVDGGREALRDGELGRLVDPDDAGDLTDALLKALDRPKAVPEGLHYFAYPNYARRRS
jgi:phosphatidyl-myo-inositol dimannoside synthase